MSGFFPLGIVRKALAKSRYTPNGCVSDGMQATPVDLNLHTTNFARTSVGMTSSGMQQMAEQWIQDHRQRIQTKWDARRERMRLERSTAKATGPSRRQGRL